MDGGRRLQIFGGGVCSNGGEDRKGKPSNGGESGDQKERKGGFKGMEEADSRGLGLVFLFFKIVIFLNFF